MKKKRIIHHRFGVVRLTALVVSFLCCTQAQSQTVNSSYKKWLDCDVDWIIGDSTFVAGPEFSIRLSFRRKPITAVRLLLGRGWTSSAGFSDMGVVATAETDSEGIARFFAIPPGTYTAIAENGLLFPSSVDIHVRSDVGPGKQETVEWPERTIPVRSLRGTLVTAEDLDDVAKPFPNVEIELLELRTSRLIETAYTNADGRYDFSTQESGVYVLRVKPPIQEGKTKSESHEVAVRLDGATKVNTIPELTVLQSDCGGLQLFRKTGKAWQAQ